MHEYEMKIAEAIYQTAIKYDRDLSQEADEGIFFMPELAFVFQCGLEIMRKRNSIFGNSKVEWLREINLGNGGPCDLAFIINDSHKIVLEFKLRNTSTSYLRDIEKLSKLSPVSHTRLFCALIDVFQEQPQDGRLVYLNTHSPTPLKKIFCSSFPTKTSYYQKPISCQVMVWKL
ncbi:hypothetical protein [Photobacterium marinum]|uniref:hypothetical protein n=1 Tax=Photobacterium marinum TaxID=1056511 RepID=UPI00056D6A9D|nr:hypothetical protein [Photobacterium marinum]